MTENKLFHGNIFAWIFGVVLLFGTVMLKDFESLETERCLGFNLNNFRNAQEIIDHCNYINKILVYNHKKM